MSLTKSTRDASIMKIRRERNVTLSYLLLTKSNYSVWALKMQVNLKAQGVWEQTQGVWEAVMLNEVDERKDRMALSVIYQALPDEILLMVAEKDFVKQAWKTLKTMHVGVERVKETKLQTLKTHFETIHMMNGESVDDFAIKLTSIMTSICLLGVRVEEIFVVKKIFKDVPKKSIQIVTVIEQFGDLKNMIVEEITGRLKITRRDFTAIKTKRRRITSCSHMVKGCHE
ncbi:uncharacterized protein LOC124911915 [Impatiens glandulifera]|uniref:uncharacterized protein LOC124911915 n=1 Tax=Impatiens glandulifera TaxID=253017 RepID=UPI001FB09AB5|nr:uncharacterized protein LOC124911915 [Impatiens glandulifera]